MSIDAGTTADGRARRAPNIRDVAARAGVSHQTVSRVLNDSPRLTDGTRDRVLAAIAELGYRPNQAARTLVTSRTRTIGVLAVLTAQYGPATAIGAIASAARDAGYRISLTNAAADDGASLRASLDHLLAQSVEAVVVIAPQAEELDEVQRLSASVPMVTLEAPIDGTGISLAVDQVAGARAAVRHLIGLGHRRIAHLAGPQDWVEAVGRRRGYELELADQGLAASEPIVGDWSSASGYAAGLALLAGGSDATAVFCGNDQMALGLLHACRDRGVDVPARLSVVGFDDIPESAHFAPPLTTVRQDFAELGRRSIAYLLAELGGAAPGDRTMVAPELVVRASTAPPSTAPPSTA